MNRERLVMTERWLLVEELGSKVRHKVRNKLGSVRNAAFFIRRSLEKSATPVPPRLHTFFQLIDDELCAADQTLGQPRLRAADGTSPPRVLLRDCIDSALSFRPPPPQVSVVVNCAPELALTGSGEELCVALLCLIDNACEAAAPAGRVAIAAVAAPEHIVVVVSDSGSGFDAEAAEHALTAFFTTKPGHLGLGLNIVERVVKDHGGQIHLDPAAVPVKNSARDEMLGGAHVTLVLPQVLALATDPPTDAETT